MAALAIAMAAAASWATARASVIHAGFHQAGDFAVIEGQDKAKDIGSADDGIAIPSLLTSLLDQTNFATANQPTSDHPIKNADGVVHRSRGTAAPADVGVPAIQDLTDFDTVDSLRGALSLSGTTDQFASDVPAAEQRLLSPIGGAGQLATTAFSGANYDTPQDGLGGLGNEDWLLQSGSDADPADSVGGSQLAPDAPLDLAAGDPIEISAPPTGTPAGLPLNQQPDPLLALLERLFEFVAFLHAIWPITVLVALAGGGPIAIAFLLRRPQRP